MTIQSRRKEMLVKFGQREGVLKADAIAKWIFLLRNHSLSGIMKIRNKFYEMKEGLTMLKVINTEKAPAAIGPYSQAMVFGNLMISSGQIPIDPATGEN